MTKVSIPLFHIGNKSKSVHKINTSNKDISKNYCNNLQDPLRDQLDPTVEFVSGRSCLELETICQPSGCLKYEI